MPRGWLVDMQLSRTAFLHTVMDPKTRGDDVMSSAGQTNHTGGPIKMQESKKNMQDGNDTEQGRRK